MPIDRAETQRRRSERRYGLKAPTTDGDRCTATTLAGKLCPNAKVAVTLPMRGKKIDEENGELKRVKLTTCMAHAPQKVRVLVGFTQHGKGGRKPKPSVPQLMREMVEEHAGEVMAAFFEALEAEKPVVVGNGPHAKLKMVPDPSTRMRAGDSLLDRVYGKPKQTTEVTGGEGGPVRVHLPDDEERARQVADVLKQTGVV
jgi:hypothetical protein